MADRSCRIVSIGSNNQWAFERSIFERTNCRVDTLDCTGKGKGWRVPADISSRVRLHSICLGTEEKYDTYTWAHAMRAINITSPPSWLKIDCEGCERTVLPELVQAGNHLLPDQISMEIHFGEVVITPENLRAAEAKKPLADGASRFYKQLYVYGGYFLIHRLDNPAMRPKSRGCSEILLARGTCQTDNKRIISEEVSLFNPAVDWLKATNGPCVLDESILKQTSLLHDGRARQHCEPWDRGIYYDNLNFCSWQLNDAISRAWRREHTEECQLKLPSMPYLSIPT